MSVSPYIRYPKLQCPTNSFMKLCWLLIINTLISHIIDLSLRFSGAKFHIPNFSLHFSSQIVLKFDETWWDYYFQWSSGCVKKWCIKHLYVPQFMCSTLLYLPVPLARLYYIHRYKIQIWRWVHSGVHMSAC